MSNLLNRTLFCIIVFGVTYGCTPKPGPVSNGNFGKLVRLPPVFYEGDWIGFAEAGSEWYLMRLSASTGSLMCAQSGDLESFEIIHWQATTNASRNYIVCRFADSADDLAPSNMVGTVNRFGLSAVFKSFGGYSDTCEFVG